jgi:hypothetical protein
MATISIAQRRRIGTLKTVDLERTMTFRSLIAIFVFVGLTSASALAQTNLGELLDMGGKKLSKQEAVDSLSGATASGETRDGAVFQTDYKADGTYAGSFVSPQNKRNGSTFGKWTVDDSGKVCIDGEVRIYQVYAQKSCVFYFKGGDQYYASESDSNRAAPISKRAIKK